MSEKTETKGAEKHDEEQERLLAEECILVDGDDKVTGHASKRFCHLMENIEKGVLHRAFSVFLFNSKNELLLQQRSAEKITFPLRWTNTCCSHPLYVKDELVEENNMGVKVAAIRKLEHELGIPLDSIKPEEIAHLTKIHYSGPSNDCWGEHEVDHILFIKKDVELKLNKNEVAATDYVTAEQLRKMIEDRSQRKLFITPWFHMIVNKFLYGWWENVDEIVKNKGLGGKHSSTVHKLELPDSDKH